MSGDFDDHLRRRLTELGSDVSGTRLPGPEAARHRAAQRTRHQVAGGVLGAVAVAALAVAGITQPTLFTAPEPVAPDTETPTAVPEPPDDSDGTGPTGDAVPPDGSGIPETAFLTADDLAPETEPGDEVPAWAEGDATQAPFACTPAVPAGATHVYFENGQDGHVLQFIEETDDPEGRFAELRAELESCVEEVNADQESPFNQAWEVDGVGDGAWMATYFEWLDEPIDFVETNLVAVQLVRSGDHVTVVVEGGPGQDQIGNMTTDRAETSARRLCAAFGADCVGAVQRHRVDRETAGDLPGWPAPDEVAEIAGLTGEWDASEPLAMEEASDWPVAYLPLDPIAAGATSAATRHYLDGDDPGGAGVDVTMAAFPDAGAAREHYNDMIDMVTMITMARGHDEDGVTAAETGSSDADGLALTTWRAEYPETDLTLVFGFVLQDETIVLVTHAISGWEERDLTPEQLSGLLTRFADHLR